MEYFRGRGLPASKANGLGGKAFAAIGIAGWTSGGNDVRRSSLWAAAAASPCATVGAGVVVEVPVCDGGSNICRSALTPEFEAFVKSLLRRITTMPTTLAVPASMTRTDMKTTVVREFDLLVFAAGSNGVDVLRKSKGLATTATDCGGAGAGIRMEVPHCGHFPEWPALASGT